MRKSGTLLRNGWQFIIGCLGLVTDREIYMLVWLTVRTTLLARHYPCRILRLREHCPNPKRQPLRNRLQGQSKRNGVFANCNHCVRHTRFFHQPATQVIHGIGNSNGSQASQNRAFDACVAVAPTQGRAANAPDIPRIISAGGSVRFGVLGSLSATSSPTAANARAVLTRLRLKPVGCSRPSALAMRFILKLTTAGAVMLRIPATAPAANAHVGFALFSVADMSLVPPSTRLLRWFCRVRDVRLLYLEGR